MALKILPHGRLQEWVAEEQGYFAAEGLDYTFLPEGDYGVPAEGRDEGGIIAWAGFAVLCPPGQCELADGNKRISTRLSRAAAMGFIIDSECPS